MYDYLTVEEIEADLIQNIRIHGLSIPTIQAALQYFPTTWLMRKVSMKDVADSVGLNAITLKRFEDTGDIGLKSLKKLAIWVYAEVYKALDKEQWLTGQRKTSFYIPSPQNPLTGRVGFYTVHVPCKDPGLSTEENPSTSENAAQ